MEASRGRARRGGRGRGNHKSRGRGRGRRAPSNADARRTRTPNYEEQHRRKQGGEGTSRGKGKRGGRGRRRKSRGRRGRGRNTNTDAQRRTLKKEIGANGDGNDDADEANSGIIPWACLECTFENSPLSLECAMCGGLKPDAMVANGGDGMMQGQNNSTIAAREAAADANILNGKKQSSGQSQEDGKRKQPSPAHESQIDSALSLQSFPSIDLRKSQIKKKALETKTPSPFTPEICKLAHCLAPLLQQEKQPDRSVQNNGGGSKRQHNHQRYCEMIRKMLADEGGNIEMALLRKASEQLERDDIDGPFDTTNDSSSDNSKRRATVVECFRLQVEELDSLAMILQQELSIALTRPLTFTVKILLPSKHPRGFAEISCLIPEDYPLNPKGPPVRIGAYVAACLENNIESKANNRSDDNKMSTAVAVAAATHSTKAMELVSHISKCVVSERKGDGLGYLYDLIEEARTWLSENLKERPKKRKMMQKRKGSSSSSKAAARQRKSGLPRKRSLTPRRKGSRKQLFVYDINDCETFTEDDAEWEIRRTLSPLTSLGIPEASARLMLKQWDWDVAKATEEAIRSVYEKAKIEAAASSSSSSSSSTPSPPCPRVGSNARKQRMAALSNKTTNTSCRYNLKETLRGQRCLACMEDLGDGESEGLVGDYCEHAMCLDCWEGYLRSTLNDGKTDIRCPGHKCNLPVPESAIIAVLGRSPGLIAKYRRWQCKAQLTRLGFFNCTAAAPDICKRIIKPTRVNLIRCECGHSWCGECGERIHYPVSCQTRRIYHEAAIIKLKRKDFKLSDLTEKPKALIKVDTKQCPKCRIPWEKNGGCNHFTCSCGHEFCWVCLRDWSTHGNSFYECVLSVGNRVSAKQVVFREDGVLDPPTRFKRIKDYVNQECMHHSLQLELESLCNSPEKLQEVVDDLEQKNKESNIDAAFVVKSCRFLNDAHEFIGCMYIFFSFHNNANAAYDFRDTDSIFGALLKSVNMVEYFVEALDSVMLIMPWSERRSRRDRDQVLILVKSIQDAADKVLAQIPDVMRTIVLGGSGGAMDDAFTEVEKDWKKLEENILAALPTGWHCVQCTFYNEVAGQYGNQRCQMCEAHMPRRVQRQISDTYESLRKLQLRRVAEEEKMLQREIKERQMEKAQTQERLKQLRGKESVIDVEIAKEKRKYNAIAERQFERMFHKN